jgi:hypothetical protein
MLKRTPNARPRRSLSTVLDGPSLLPLRQPQMKREHWIDLPIRSVPLRAGTDKLSSSL